MQKERVEADIRNLCRYLLFMTSQLIWTQNIWRLDFVKNVEYTSGFLYG